MDRTPTGPVEIGVFLSTRTTSGNRVPAVAELIALAEAAETAGFDSVWVGDSLLARPLAAEGLATTI